MAGVCKARGIEPPHKIPGLRRSNVKLRDYRLGRMDRHHRSLREAPKEGSTYFLAAPESLEFYDEWQWHGTDADRLWLERGLCYTTREDAIEAAKAMLERDSE